MNCWRILPPCLMVRTTKWNNIHVRPRFGSPINVVDAAMLVDDAAVDSTCDTADYAY